MQKLKEIYDIKKQIVVEVDSIYEIGEILRSFYNLKAEINPDNTMYLESECGIDSIRNSLYEGLENYMKLDQSIRYYGIFNTLPLSNNSCIVKI